MKTDSILRRGFIWTLLATALVGVMVTGSVFGGFATFRTYGGAFSRLMGRDIQLGQILYNDSVSRQLKDALLRQQDDLLNVELAAESIIREDNFLSIYWAILNETAARIAEEAIIFDNLANETAARTAIDIFFAAEIANLTSAVIVAEQFEVFSKATFLSLILNITNLQTLLTNEIAARLAGDAFIREQGALSDSAIAYLTTTLEHDIHDRMVQDVLINEWIAALEAMGTGIESINGQLALHNNVDIVSTNLLTTITAPSPGTLLFRNNAILTMQGVPPDGGNSFSLNGGAGVNVVPVPPHGLHIFTPFNPIGPNYLVLQGYAGGTFDFNPGDINNWLSFGPNMESAYNGPAGYYGWSAPDSATYIVQVSATLTICVTGAGIFPSANHINMAFARTNWVYASTHATVNTENTGGVLDAVAGSFIGDSESLPGFCMDLAMSATTIVQGAGVAGGGGISNGYGVFVFFQGTIQGIVAQPIAITYRVTKVN